MTATTSPLPDLCNDAGHVAAEIACLSCGYNLHTLHRNEKCPECGNPVEESLHGLAATDPAWRKRLSWGLLWLAAWCVVEGIHAAYVVLAKALLSILTHRNPLLATHGIEPWLTNVLFTWPRVILMAAMCIVGITIVVNHMIHAFGIDKLAARMPQRQLRDIAIACGCIIACIAFAETRSSLDALRMPGFVSQSTTIALLVAVWIIAQTSRTYLPIIRKCDDRTRRMAKTFATIHGVLILLLMAFYRVLSFDPAFGQTFLMKTSTILFSSTVGNIANIARFLAVGFILWYLKRIASAMASNLPNRLHLLTLIIVTSLFIHWLPGLLNYYYIMNPNSQAFSSPAILNALGLMYVSISFILTISLLWLAVVLMRFRRQVLQLTVVRAGSSSTPAPRSPVRAEGA